VACLEQHREHVVAALVPIRVLALLPAPLGDQLVHQSVGVLAQPPEGSEGPDPPEQTGQPAIDRRRHQADRPVAEREHRPQSIAQGVEARSRLEAEHRPQDDFERQPLQGRVELERALRRPACDVTLGDRRDQTGQPLHALAVKCRQHQPPLFHVGASVEQDHRRRTDDRLEHARSSPRREHVCRRREDLLDLLRTCDHHERRRRG